MSDNKIRVLYQDIVRQKDNMRGAKKRVLDYVKSLRQKGASSVITLYAIRDLKGKERAEVLSIKPKSKSQKKTF